MHYWNLDLWVSNECMHNQFTVAFVILETRKSTDLPSKDLPSEITIMFAELSVTRTTAFSVSCHSFDTLVKSQMKTNVALKSHPCLQHVTQFPSHY